MRPYDKPWKKVTITLLCMLAGNALLAFLVTAFVLPHGIVMGGTTGIGIVLTNLFRIDVSYVILGVNFILLIIGWIVLGRKFALTTVASTFIYPAFIWVLERIPGIYTLTDNSLMAAIFAGLLMGVAMGLVMRVGSSTGGMDIINLIFHHKFHFPLALMVYLGDIIVVGGQAIFVKPEKTLYGILVIILESIVLDRMMVIGKPQTQLFVVSDKYEEIRARLLDKMNVGVTLMFIETGMMGAESKGVMCVLPQRKLYDATELVRSVDPVAFITVTQIKEVRGRGFTEERVYLGDRKDEKARRRAAKEEKKTPQSRKKGRKEEI